MDKTINHIIVANLFKGQCFNLQNEKLLQGEIEQLLLSSGIAFEREQALSKGSIIDFLVLGVGIEVKLKSSAKSIFKQLLRYCQFDEVESIILVTNKIIRLPSSINKKPALVINLGAAWL